MRSCRSAIRVRAIALASSQQTGPPSARLLDICFQLGAALEHLLQLLHVLG